jgi:hypothetical protein
VALKLTIIIWNIEKIKILNPMEPTPQLEVNISTSEQFIPTPIIQFGLDLYGGIPRNLLTPAMRSFTGKISIL